MSNHNANEDMREIKYIAFELEPLKWLYVDVLIKVISSIKTNIGCF